MRNFSQNNIPKLIVETGLSIVCGVSGMKELAECLKKEFNELAHEIVNDAIGKYCLREVVRLKTVHEES